MENKQSINELKMCDWYNRILKAKKSCINQLNLWRVHYEFENGQEMVEEYNMDTKVLTRRAWKIKNELGNEDGWNIEVGDPEPAALTTNNSFIKENISQPFITKRVTKRNLEWRIRNLPYPVQVYSVTVDQDNKSIIIRTSNKKYFKKLTIPELERVNVAPQQDKLSFTHKFNTLIITYIKPKEVLDLEKAVLDEVLKLTPKNDAQIGDCKPS